MILSQKDRGFKVQQKEHYILVGRNDVSEYALRTIIALRETAEDEVVVIKGRGDNISKAVDVYNEVASRIGDALKVVSVNIGSDRVGRRKMSFIEIKLKMTL